MSKYTVGDKIAELREAAGMTQSQLAEKLGVSHQAVSQWENASAAPDIMLLPAIADIFGVSIDGLFGRSGGCYTGDAPADDGVIRAVVFDGNRLVASERVKGKLLSDKTEVVFRYEGDARDVRCDYSLDCRGDITGAAAAGHSLSCGGNIGGAATAGHSLTCDGNIGGSASAGHSLSCGQITKGARAGHGIDCKGDIYGDVSAGHGVKCKTVNGNVKH